MKNRTSTRRIAFGSPVVSSRTTRHASYPRIHGITHIEAPEDRSFTLGDFFAVWGKPLSRTRAASTRAASGHALEVWVGGKPYTGDPRAIKLEEHTDIVIEAGPPFPPPRRFTNWGSL